jgi:hypothetical protein
MTAGCRGLSPARLHFLSHAVFDNNDAEFSLVLGETSSVNASTLMFSLSLGFFGRGQQISLANEKQSWAFSWTPMDPSSSSYKHDTPSSSSVSTFFTPSKSIDIPCLQRWNDRGEEAAPQWLWRAGSHAAGTAARYARIRRNYTPDTADTPELHVPDCMVLAYRLYREYNSGVFGRIRAYREWNPGVFGRLERKAGRVRHTAPSA